MLPRPRPQSHPNAEDLDSRAVGRVGSAFREPGVLALHDGDRRKLQAVGAVDGDSGLVPMIAVTVDASVREGAGAAVLLMGDADRVVPHEHSLDDPRIMVAEVGVGTARACEPLHLREPRRGSPGFQRVGRGRPCRR